MVLDKAPESVTIGGCLLLPSSTQTLVNLHQRQQFAQLSLNQAKLGCEVIGVVGEDLKVASGSACVP